LSGITLDAGALIALDREGRRAVELIARTISRGKRITIPATALAQAIRNPAKQVRISRLLRRDVTDVVSLDEHDSKLVGSLLARTGTSDIVDAHVVVCARRTGQYVLTSDPGDFERLAPDLDLVLI
jgi:predicted nucleic acid-binding protein